MTIEKNINDEPFYSDEYMPIHLEPNEIDDVFKQLKVSPMVMLKRNKLNDLILNSAAEKIKNANSGIGRILLAQNTNDKPPTLEDYLKLGITIGNLTDSERETVLEMLNKTIFKPKDK
tara:strand:- start:288 stop:641 length:354 start_codon:yes stop_codon:yes gene_type:complete